MLLLVLSLAVVIGVAWSWWGWHTVRRQASFLPPWPPNGPAPSARELPPFQHQTPWYRLTVSNGTLTVTSPDGARPVLDALEFCSECRPLGSTTPFQPVRGFWSGLAHQPAPDGGTTLTLAASLPYGELELTAHLAPDSPEIPWEAHLHTHQGIQVWREALVCTFAPPVSRILLRNGTRATPPWREEYWLGRHGVAFGNGDAAALIHYPRRISSLQLQPVARRLWINLEHAPDHPRTWYPLEAELQGLPPVDASPARRAPGTSLRGAFTIRFGPLPPLLPALPPTPGGHAATYVITEHACYSDPRLHRAVYLGSETLSHPEQALGGFVRHRIPVTKSLFYANHCATTNATQSTLFSSPVASLQGDPGFHSLLEGLHATGLVELCLHAPQHLPAPPELTGEAVRFFAQRFGARTWIDHRHAELFNNATPHPDAGEPPPDSPSHQARELWQEWGTRFFWSTAREFIPLPQWHNPRVRRRFPLTATEAAEPANDGTRPHPGPLLRGLSPRAVAAFARSPHSPGPAALLRNLLLRGVALLQVRRAIRTPDLLLSRSGPQFPTPLHWRHPESPPAFIHWPTHGVHFGPMPKGLGRLVRDRGVFINHCYPVSTQDGTHPDHPANPCWSLDPGGRLRVSPAFDAHLQDLAHRRRRRDLHLTTVGELLEYWTALDQLEIRFPPDGRVTIRNPGPLAITGLTIALEPCPAVLLEGTPSASRRLGRDRLHWFDLPPGHTVTLIPAPGAHPP